MVTTQEVQPTTMEVESDASGQLNQTGYGELNQGTNGTGAYSDATADEAASESEGDGTETDDDIDPEIVQRVLARREREIRDKLDPELRKFHSMVQKREAMVSKTAKQQMQTQINHLRERLEAMGLDPTELQLDVLNAKQITTRDAVKQQFEQGERTWKQEEPNLLAGFSEFAQANGVHPVTGQWVVDTKDPELVTLQRKAIEAAQMYVLSGQDDDQLAQQANAYAEQWRQTLKAKAKAGNGSGTPTSQPKQQQPRQQATALAAAAKRGPVVQGRPGGGSAPVTFQDYLSQAKAEMPGKSQRDLYTRALELKMLAKESLRT